MMKIKRKVILLLTATVGLLGFQDGFLQGGGGMLYRIIKHNDGPLIKPDDIVYFNGTLKAGVDSIIANTYDKGIPSFVRIPRISPKGDLMSALQMLTEGDSAIFKLNVDSMYKRSPQAKPRWLKGKYFEHTVKIEKVLTRKNGEPDSLFIKRSTAYLKSWEGRLKAEEPGKIARYIATKKLNVNTTPSGLNYVIANPGSGLKPRTGDTVVVNFTGVFLNGKVFETSIEAIARKYGIFRSDGRYLPAIFPLTGNVVMPGWDEGLRLLAKGGRATFIIPSRLAYGEQNAGPIGPNTPLMYDLELIDIKWASTKIPAKSLQTQH